MIATSTNLKPAMSSAYGLVEYNVIITPSRGINTYRRDSWSVFAQGEEKPYILIRVAHAYAHVAITGQ